MADGKLILCFAVIFLLQQNVSGFNRNRIINGSSTPKNVFEFLPFLVLVSPTNDFLMPSICSSTIISKRHILTAAHCIYSMGPAEDLSNGAYRLSLFHNEAIFVDYRPKNTIIEIKNKGIQIPLKDYSYQPKVFVHPSYSTVNMFANDIAIIEFPESTDLGITPITLVSKFFERNGDSAIAAGYGVYEQAISADGIPYNLQFPTELQNVTVPLHTPRRCKDTVGRTPKLICTGTSNYKAASGDSGGPLMIERNGKFYQVGILSAGLLNNALYTRLSLQCDWISKVTKGQVNCKALPDESTSQPSTIDPVNPQTNQPLKPNGNNQTIVLLNETVAVTSLPVPSKPEAYTDDSSIAFAFNIFFSYLLSFF